MNGAIRLLRSRRLRALVDRYKCFSLANLWIVVAVVVMTMIGLCMLVRASLISVCVSRQSRWLLDYLIGLCDAFGSISECLCANLVLLVLDIIYSKMVVVAAIRVVAVVVVVVVDGELQRLSLSLSLCACLLASIGRCLDAAAYAASELASSLARAPLQGASALCLCAALRRCCRCCLHFARRPQHWLQCITAQSNCCGAQVM